MNIFHLCIIIFRLGVGIIDVVVIDYATHEGTTCTYLENSFASMIYNVLVRDNKVIMLCICFTNIFIYIVGSCLYASRYSYRFICYCYDSLFPFKTYLSIKYNANARKCLFLYRNSRAKHHSYHYFDNR